MANAGFPWRAPGAAVAGLVASAILVLSMPVSVQAAVPVPERTLRQLATVCSDGSACVTATAELVSALGQDNPEVPVDRVLTSVAATLIDAYNDGEFPPGLVATILTAVSSIAEANGLSELSGTLRTAVELALAGAAIEADAVIVRSASPS